MQLKYLLPTLLLLGNNCITHAQQPYYNQQENFLKANGVWCFYTKYGLNFNNRINFQFATSLSSGYNGAEGCASVSDSKTGTLLFYSNGGNCYNKNNVIMPNGSGLLGNSSFYSTTQGVCIVPFPKNPNRYYLFSLSTKEVTDLSPAQLYYSVVDMNLDNGQGDIVSTKKNILLDSALLSESMVAVPGNNCDIWLLTHAKDSAVFKAYHITSAGINSNPVRSYTGTQIHGVITGNFFGNTISFQAYWEGSMKISPDKQKIAITSTNPAYSGIGTISSSTGLTVGTLVGNFNATTGVISNAILIDTFGGYDVAFSPDNSKLYLSSTLNVHQLMGIYQFDVSVMDSAAIVNSKKIVLGPSNFTDYFSLKLYNDTIYVNRPDQNAIDRINQPNLSGIACNYESNAITFSTGPLGLGWSLPSDVVLPPTPDSIYSRIIDTTICWGWDHGITLKPIIPDDDYVYEWSNGSTDSILTVIDSGIYWVKYNNGCHYRVDTFALHGSDLDPVINVNVFDLSTTISYHTYQWMLGGHVIPGATDSVYTVTQNGQYQVIVSNEYGCTDTSAVYEVTNYTAIDNVGEIAPYIKILPNPAHDQVYIRSSISVNVILTNTEGKELLRQANATTLDISSLATGMYILQFTDSDNRPLKKDKLIKWR